MWWDFRQAMQQWWALTTLATVWRLGFAKERRSGHRLVIEWTLRLELGRWLAALSETPREIESGLTSLPKPVQLRLILKELYWDSHS